MPLSRRNFLKLGAGTALAAASGTVTYAMGDTLSLERQETTVVVPGLPKSFENYRIGFLSDLHLGVFIPNDFIQLAVDFINRSNVDILLLGGDYVWLQESAIAQKFGMLRNPRFAGPPTYDLAYEIFRDVGRITSGAKTKDGIFAVYGNHDRWVEPRLCRELLSQAGVHFLVNERKEIVRGTDYLSIVATDDYWTGVPRITPPLKKNRPHEVRILLTHNPDYASYTLDNSQFEFDLALCGHTHGGQIKVPVVGALHYNIQDLRFAEGLATHPRGQVYTSRGVGVVEVPWRVNCPPEVTIIELRGI